MKEIKIILWGFGAMGKSMAENIMCKKGLKIVAVLDKDEKILHRDIGDILNISSPSGILVRNDFNNVIRNIDADIVILAIDSYIEKVIEYIELILENKKNCITLAEEMIYPYTTNFSISSKIHRLAKENNVTILGTGINPGFVLDSMIVFMSSVCNNITRINASRINDLSPYGLTVLREQGVGLSQEEFGKGILNGNIVGHIGFKQSIEFISNAIGLEVDDFIEFKEPIITNTYRETKFINIQPGMVAGCLHSAYGLKSGNPVIVLEHPQQICPESETIDTGDYISIEGDPNIHLNINPELPGGVGSAAITVNLIPQVIACKSGLKTMLDMKLPHGVQGNFAELLKKYRVGDLYD